jgi:Ca-activated chloride channel family protein
MSRLATPWALALLPLAALSVWWLLRRAEKRDARLAFPSLHAIAGIAPSPWAQLARVLPWLRGAAIVLAIVALARPQAGASLTTVSTEGVDIVVALDVSGSMRCEDERSRPRLSVAKQCLDRFIEGRPSDRIGLVSFATLAATRCPLTLDHDMLRDFVGSIEFAPSGEDQTAIGMGLGTALNRLRSSKAKSKVVVLLTDGRNNAGQVGPEAAAEAARSLGIKLYTIGVGSRGPVPCLVDTPDGGRTYVRVEADLDEDLLKAMAESTGGRSFRATDSDGLAAAFHEIDSLEKTSIESRVRVLYTEKFPLLLAPAALILGLELFLAATRLRRIP